MVSNIEATSLPINPPSLHPCLTAPPMSNCPAPGNEIGDEGAAALGRGLATNRGLAVLDLWDNKVGDAGAIALATALEAQSDEANAVEGYGGDEGLTELHLCWNEIGDEGGVALANALQNNQRLTRLCLWDNSIGTEQRHTHKN